MRFAQFSYINGFFVVFAVCLFLIWAFKAKKSLLYRFAEEKVLDKIVSSVDFRKYRVRCILVISVLVLSVIALMRPQWGFQWQQVKRTGLDILIAIDTSKSMLATDVKPDRLDRSKLAVRDLIKKLKGDRLGLIAFSGTSFLQCPLTIDYNGFLLSLNDLSIDTVPMGGTSISKAIALALKSYEKEQKKYKVLVIITDGEDHEGDAIKFAETAAKEGIRIFCIGIGTREGELIPLSDGTGKTTFLKDLQGNVVKTRLNEELLQKIALSAGGTYVRASGAEFGLDFIYEERLSKMERRDLESQMNKAYSERFQLPLALALIILVCELFITDKKRI